ncbi:hypothetical protein M0R45_024074 [Rubus argutus]|uniref:Protein FAR1-RELATED SEQUENCE n=1 Tax=Rubus argutus TaxID=59490 RepID=A0AAW1WQ34_RUBAR
MENEDDDSNSRHHLMDKNEHKGCENEPICGENVPILGMTFDSDQDAYDYYNSYARVVGFSVRRLRSNRDKHTGFKPSQIFSYMTVEAGGPGNLNFIQTDCNNYIRRTRAEFLKKACVYDPETIEEFESSWKDLLDYYDLKENGWLKELYQLREKWAQVYGRSNFCAGMTTTQRSESINKYLKKFFSKNLILSEWVVQHERALVHRREKERLAEVATTQTKHNFLSNWKVEVEAAEMYTKKLFNCFQEEYQKCLDLRLELETDDGIVETYVVHRPGNPNFRRSLVYSPSNQSLDCSCKRFQFEGILCSHALKLLRELGLSTIPSKYYLKRWRRDARDGVDFQSYGEANLSDRSSSSVLQYSHLSHIAQRIVAKGAKDKQSCALVKSKLLELEAVLDSNSSIGQEHETNVDIDSCDEVNENNTNLVLRDPKTKKRRGRSKGKKKNDLGLKQQSKKKSSSELQEKNAQSLPKKRKAPSKTKDSHETNSHGHEISGHTNSHEHVQVFQQVNMPRFPTSGAQGIPSHFPHVYPPTTSGAQGMPSHFPHVFPPTTIPNQSLGYQVIRPMIYDYSVMYSQAITQPRLQGPARQLQFSDPSKS